MVAPEHEVRQESFGDMSVMSFAVVYADLCVALRRVLLAQQSHGFFPNPLMRQLCERMDRVTVQALPHFRPSAYHALGDSANVLKIVRAIGGDTVWHLVKAAFTAALTALQRDHPDVPLVWMHGTTVKFHPGWSAWLQEAMECALLPLCQFAHLRWCRMNPHRQRESEAVCDMLPGPGNPCRLPLSRAEGGRVSFALRPAWTV